jgi:hypothetical protein
LGYAEQEKEQTPRRRSSDVAHILNYMLGKIGIIIAVVVFVLIAIIIMGNRMMKSELEKDTKKF